MRDVSILVKLIGSNYSKYGYVLKIIIKRIIISDPLAVAILLMLRGKN